MFHIWLRPRAALGQIGVGPTDAILRHEDTAEISPEIPFSPHFSPAFYCGGGSGHVIHLKNLHYSGTIDNIDMIIHQDRRAIKTFIKFMFLIEEPSPWFFNPDSALFDTT
jgi:hypothetical protein